MDDLLLAFTRVYTFENMPNDMPILQKALEFSMDPKGRIQAFVRCRVRSPASIVYFYICQRHKAVSKQENHSL